MKTKNLLLFIIFLIPFYLDSVAQTIDRGPYLQLSTTQSIYIHWRTDSATDTKVWYGDSPGNLNLTVASSSDVIDHEIQITGLAENTIYYYAVGNASGQMVGGDSDHYFKTSPNSNQPIKAWVLGDAGKKDDNQRAVRDAYYNHIGNEHIDMMLLLGDNAYSDGTQENYQEAWFENMYEARLINSVMWSTFGNHDAVSATSSTETGPYYDIFNFPKSGEAGGVASGTEAYFSFDYGNVHIISLNSEDIDATPNSPMIQWLQDDVNANTKDWLVAMCHHPTYRGDVYDIEANALPILEAEGVDLVLVGHYHRYERSFLINGHYGSSGSYDPETMTIDPGNGRIDGDGAYTKTTSGPDAGVGTVFVITGSAGSVSSGSSPHPIMAHNAIKLGSVDMEVNGFQMDIKFIDDTGSVEDYFTIIKEGPCDPVNDSDGDGICDASDQCPGEDDNIIGTGCDDGDPCTTNDIYDNSCLCAGTFTDADGDGLCISDDPDDNDGCNPDPNSPACDPCSSLSSDDFEIDFGTWNDGGNDCSRVSSNANSGSYSIRLRDDSGVNGSMFTNDMDLSIYDEVTVDFSFYPNSMENNEDFFFEISTDGGNQYDILYQEWNAGIDFQNNMRYDETILITDITLSTTTRFRFRCDASGNNDQVYIDDIVINGCAANCNTGDPCDDGDECTTGDVFDVNCNCSGIFLDSDNDSVCDAFDQCDGINDNIIGTSCDDGDHCTTSDVYDNSCLCVGIFTDADNDGLCIGEDPDDNDGCNPDPNSPSCSPCSTETSDDFESGFGNWNDGGNDCFRVASNPNSGSYSIRLRDNSGTNASIYTDDLDLSTYNEAQIDFYYYTTSMESGEDFLLEYSLDGGNSYSQYEDWISGSDFDNNSGYFETVILNNIAFTSTTRFRLRCDASANNDQIYIDDIIIIGCGSNQNSMAINDSEYDISAVNLNMLVPNQSNENDSPFDLKVFPNPTKDILHVDTGILNSNGVISIYNMHGKLIYQLSFNELETGILELNLNQFQDGIYMLHLNTSERQSAIHKFVIMK